MKPRSERLDRRLVIEVARFGVTGLVGFLVDASILSLLVATGVPPLLARIVSFPCALLVTWLLNSKWTFGAHRGKSRMRQATGYIVVQCTGMAVNYAVFALALQYTGGSSAGSVLALAFASAISMIVTFMGSRFLVFNPGKPKTP